MGFSDLLFHGPVGKHMTPRLLLTTSTLAVSTYTHGFDAGAFNGAQAVDGFVERFGDLQPDGSYEISSQWLSYLNALIYLTFAVGVVISSWLNARVGRRWTMIIISLWADVSIIIMVTATTRGQLLVGRLANFMYIGGELAVIPLYQSEISPSAIRGFWTGMYQMSLITGVFLMQCILRACQHLEGDLQWQIPFALITIFPTYVSIALYFCPESPRWLLLKGRDEDARKALHALHGKRPGGFDVDLELELMRDAIRDEPGQGQWRELVQGANKKRLVVVLALYFFLQATGQAFTSQYGAVFVRQLGSFNPINITLISTGAATIGCFLSLYFITDRFGRKSLLMISVFLMGCILMTMGGLGVPDVQTKPMKNAIVACQVIFAFLYVAGPAPVTYTITSEVAPLHLRDKCQRLGALMNTAIQALVNGTLSYAIRSIGSQVGFAFGSMCFLQVMFTFFLVPDCQGRSLEEVDHMYNIGVPARKFATYHDAHISALLTDLEARKKSAGEVADVRHEKDHISEDQVERAV